ncbi:MAG: S-adenosylmethionine:tRNA ribosyltransferase-isomerase [Salinivirgaceae bacterium]|nr:S-adenosylmethionine:tRNA ribosyltransferase-isomerase [Salinivirgaceae bacterium]
MNAPVNISIADYNYPLPDERIAKYPLEIRDSSKLLIFDNGEIETDVFRNVANHLPSPALLVANNTKVIRARMEFFKTSGARIEIFCLEPVAPAEYAQMFVQTEKCQWLCYVGNSKKWKDGSLNKQITIGNQSTTLSATRIGAVSDSFIVEFQWDNNQISFGEILDWAGQIPIPPYLNRQSEESDNERYQTVYSKFKGSVAAPTAGLHFTQQVFDSLIKHNISRHEVTLHVGAGTFKPVQSETIGGHPMHTEHFVLNETTLAPLATNSNRLVAVGTTTVRTLESMYWCGVKVAQGLSNPLSIGQWEPYSLQSDLSANQAFSALRNYVAQSGKTELMAETSIMIAPGYKFRVVNDIITNFHQPQSTLLLLIAAQIGEDWHRVYDFALKNDFRFLSYGDSCLLKGRK